MPEFIKIEQGLTKLLQK